MGKFSDAIAQIAQHTQTDLESVCQRFAFSIFARCIMRSPVDTGHFRANWRLGFDGVDTTTDETTDWGYVNDRGVGKSRTKDEVEAGLLSRQLVGHTVYLSNALPYAEVLEYGGYPNPPKAGSWDKREHAYVIKSVGGYSKQAPQGMVRLTVQEADTTLDEAVAEIKSQRS